MEQRSEVTVLKSHRSFLHLLHLTSLLRQPRLDSSIQTDQIDSF